MTGGQVPAEAVTTGATILVDEWQTVQADFMTLEELAQHISRKMLEAAAPHITGPARQDEREAIIRLARERGAYTTDRVKQSFADLLEGGVS